MVMERTRNHRYWSLDLTNTPVPSDLGTKTLRLDYQSSVDVGSIGVHLYPGGAMGLVPKYMGRIYEQTQRDGFGINTNATGSFLRDPTSLIPLGDLDTSQTSVELTLPNDTDITESMAIVLEPKLTTQTTISDVQATFFRREGTVIEWDSEAGTGPWMPLNRYDYRGANNCSLAKSFQIWLDGTKVWNDETWERGFPSSYFDTLLPQTTLGTLRPGLNQYILDETLGIVTDGLMGLGNILRMEGIDRKEFVFTSTQPSSAEVPLELLFWMERFRTVELDFEVGEVRWGK